MAMWGGYGSGNGNWRLREAITLSNAKERQAELQQVAAKQRLLHEAKGYAPRRSRFVLVRLLQWMQG